MQGADQIIAPSLGLLPQEISLHVDVAVAEQDEIEPWLGPADIRDGLRGPDAPIIPRAFLQLAAIAIQQLLGIAPMGRAEPFGSGGKFFLLTLLGQEIPLMQRTDRPGND